MCQSCYYRSYETAEGSIFSLTWAANNATVGVSEFIPRLYLSDYSLRCLLQRASIDSSMETWSYNTWRTKAIVLWPWQSSMHQTSITFDNLLPLRRLHEKGVGLNKTSIEGDLLSSARSWISPHTSNWNNHFNRQVQWKERRVTATRLQRSVHRLQM